MIKGLPRHLPAAPVEQSVRSALVTLRYRVVSVVVPLHQREVLRTHKSLGEVGV